MTSHPYVGSRGCLSPSRPCRVASAAASEFCRRLRAAVTIGQLLSDPFPSVQGMDEEQMTPRDVAPEAAVEAAPGHAMIAGPRTIRSSAPLVATAAVYERLLTGDVLMVDDVHVFDTDLEQSRPADVARRPGDDRPGCP